jgi:hypothetical protein
MTTPRRSDARQQARGGGLRMELVFEDATTGDEDDLIATMREWIESRHIGRVSIRVADSTQDLAQTRPPKAGPALAGAQRRGEARLVQWTLDGTLVPVSTVEQAWGIKRQSVDAARARGEIFSVYVRGQHWYPAEALKIDRQALAAVVRALGDESPTSKLLFLLRHHGALGGLTSAEAVEHGMLQDVIRVASAVSDS